MRRDFYITTHKLCEQTVWGNEGKFCKVWSYLKRNWCWKNGVNRKTMYLNFSNFLFGYHSVLDNHHFSSLSLSLSQVLSNKKCQTEGQRSHQREWPSPSSVHSWLLLSLLWSLPVSLLRRSITHSWPCVDSHVMNRLLLVFNKRWTKTFFLSLWKHADHRTSPSDDHWEQKPHRWAGQISCMKLPGLIHCSE